MFLTTLEEIYAALKVETMVPLAVLPMGETPLAINLATELNSGILNLTEINGEAVIIPGNPFADLSE